jgi:hypothetical protein
VDKILLGGDGVHGKLFLLIGQEAFRSVAPQSILHRIKERAGVAGFVRAWADGLKTDIEYIRRYIMELKHVR